MDVLQEASTTVILAEDEASLYLQATVQAVWSPTGQTPVVRADPSRTKTNFYGTLNLLTGQELARRADKLNAESSATHLTQILETYPDVPILLFWDRAPWHQGSPLRRVLEANPRLEVISFPVATPKLNPQEHVWKEVRRAVSHNHLQARLPELADHFEQHLTTTIFQSSFLDRYGYTRLRPMFI